MWFDATGLTWVNPSPNMRSLNEAALYPGVGLLETTNLSVGRGTDTPFEVIGAPWTNLHVLFLLSLLLPAVLVREAGRWVPVPGFRQALWKTFVIVTAFTAAHSLTLTLAALEVFSLPSRWVESAIAASVMVAALVIGSPDFQKR